MFSLFANWKSHKNLTTMREWYYAIRDRVSADSVDAMSRGVLEIVIFPPLPLAYPLHTLCIATNGMKVGAQDVSPNTEGPFTGLVNASSLHGIASHVIVGHVEERKRGDTDEIVTFKYDQVLHHALHPILCISEPHQQIKGAEIVAYEPVGAIGSGVNAQPSDVVSFKHDLPYPVTRYIYGGSVTASNCKEYLNPRVCDGFLVGSVSLDPIGFSSLIDVCAKYAVD